MSVIKKSHAFQMSLGTVHNLLPTMRRKAAKVARLVEEKGGEREKEIARVRGREEEIECI